MERKVIIGVLGGMGPLATAAFLEHIVHETVAERDQDHILVVADSDPRVPDGTASVFGTGEDPRPRLIQATRRLQKTGSVVIAMPCSTANLFVH